ncbi:MAG: DUF421 domain-containing protein [Clostridia bacterium]|nr:DUF421 domain-containing protein [Clostridia bacterium]
MLVSFVRTIILYFAVMAAIRVMGKRQIGELQPSELVITIILGDLASVPMQETGIPITSGIVPIITLVFTEVVISFLCLKSKKLRSFLSGRPSIVIQNGEINTPELRRLRLNVDDLLEELRNKDVSDINDVDMAIVDTNGQMCIIPKPDRRPLTPRDIGLTPDKETLPYTLVSDGRIISDNLKKTGKTEEWLTGEIKKSGYTVRDIILATYSESGGLKIQRR